MPQERYLTLNVNNENLELPSTEDDLNIRINYTLEEPESFMSKQGADPLNITVPATKKNDQIFNTFHNPQVEDLSPGALGGSITSYTELPAGTGYLVGDTITILGGATPCTLMVVTISGGGYPVGTIIIDGGSGYSIGLTYTTSSSGIGTGLLITVTSVDTLAGGNSFRELMPCVLSVNGSNPILNGYALLTDCNFTEKPESYDLTLYGGNGTWVIDLQNVTLWDCVSKVTHSFDIATIKGSWSGFNSSEVHDFVYAPVRYSQPFDGTFLGYLGDNCVNIYHLRPSISLYWMLVRAFRQIGYSITSEFFQTNYFQGLVLPWVWGDFYDINSQLVQDICFQAAGELPSISEPPPEKNSVVPFWTGSTTGTTNGSVGGSSWWGVSLHGGWEPTLYSAGTLAAIGNGIKYNTVIGLTSLVSGGTGYAPGDLFIVIRAYASTGAPTLATGTVNTVGGGGNVLTYTITGSGDATSEGYASGRTCTTSTTGGGTGFTIKIETNSSFHPITTDVVNHGYIFNGSGTTIGGFDRFNMDISSPPEGRDDFLLYLFDSVHGEMFYNFTPPPSFVGTINDATITFVISLYTVITAFVADGGFIGIEILHTKASGGTILSCQSIMPSGGQASGGGTTYPNGSGFATTPTVCNFTVPNMNPGDNLSIRLVALADNVGGGGVTFGVFTGGFLNNNPTVLGVSNYVYNPVTKEFQFITPNAVWSPIRSRLTMTGFLVQLGNDINFQNYDAFRNYNVLDMIGGVVDMFNLEVTSDNINNTVFIEPMFGSKLPTLETIGGYLSVIKILDWSRKRDYSQGKGGRISLFNSSERQIDLSFKLDSSDYSQTIWSQRNKGIYLNNRTYTGGYKENNLNIDNGIIAGVPGSSRYVLPNRFAKGNKQLVNRFFSAVMHCRFPQWTYISDVTPQLITMFPDGATGSAAVNQSYSPKLAWYGGERDVAEVGGWIFIGDPSSPDVPATLSPMPFMCAVNYVEDTPNGYPVLSYSDENINGVKVKGLMSQFYLQRFAIIRNGQLAHFNLNLNLNDVTNWQHKECIMINGTLYALIQIEGYNPLNEDSTPCTLWKVVLPEEVDVQNSYPSTTSIISNPLTLSNSFDLRYSQLLIHPTDLPQIQ